MSSFEFDLKNITPDELRHHITTDLSMQVSIRNHLGLLEEYIDWVIAGKKNTTVRYRSGMADLPKSFILPVISTDPRIMREGYQVGIAHLKKLTIKPFGELNDEDAHNDGFQSLIQLKDALRSIYGKINDKEIVSIYSFDYENGLDLRWPNTTCM